VLNGEDTEKVQVLLLCVGLAKLVLASMISDDRVRSPRRGLVGVLMHAQVLKSLVVAYLSPDMAENQTLRQCLVYFFPVSCYSSSVNQKWMRQVRWISLVLILTSTSVDDNNNRLWYRYLNSSQKRRGIGMTIKKWCRPHRLSAYLSIGPIHKRPCECMFTLCFGLLMKRVLINDA
jgi:hypothetical protein